MCHFNVYLRKGNCKTPEPPFGGTYLVCHDVNNFYKRCMVKCNDGKAFLRPVPKFFSCGPIGLWNTDSPMTTFKFPPCGDSGTVKKHLLFGWDFDLADAFTADKANEMKEQLRQKFVYWNTNLTTLHPGTAFCAYVNCSDVSITVTNHKGQFPHQD
ncbi:hypothetical protein NP493_905g00034 [Ridgeia piscesae]|uniref:Uncharacterized protein n=1 Tax=Ridgeia piscesae TaxID=27915 RepID=A0AAD9NLK4_RIDPI|nr:hypothetical protein NP493_905g00034 [Ridgeia piscesae]